MLPTFIPLFTPPLAWIRPFAVVEPPIDTLLAKVDTPATLKLSKFVCPSTSKSASKSIFPVVVVTPEMFTLSKSVSYTHLTLPTNRIV